MHIFAIGPPLTCGGANQELGDTILLWRRAGIDVTCLCFSRCRCGGKTNLPDDSNPWIARLTDAGVTIAVADAASSVPGLAGSIMVAMCHSHAAHNWPAMHAMGCKLVWSPCMNFILRHESETFGSLPPTAAHFQSHYQAGRLGQQYADWGCRRQAIIRGAFEPLTFTPRVHHGWAGEPFVVGRLARANRPKWSPHLWGIFDDARARGVEAIAMCQGWNASLDAHCGKPPKYAGCAPENTLDTTAFLAQCHALICPNWGCEENWPRVGLEAMSAGVPLIVDDAGGWREMCGQAAIYCKTPADFAMGVERLANDPHCRDKIIELGRKRVAEIASPSGIADAWVGLFSAL